ncbi:polysaccharide deacetylase family protein [Sporichthya brevicatena]|uniref:Polysaccharide deacetylase family protein n=1 Tax=Sporichthya brevicatena TaxID=171442 RepID=A0ABP3S7Q7_9ACTN
MLSGCSSDDDDPNVAESPAPTAGETTTPTPDATPEPSAVDPASVKANELAAIPVMMYHQVKAEVCSACVYDQTPAEFKAELARMHKAGFVPITVAQMVAGEIDVPAGKHPVVLTFDDSSASQIQIDADGNPTPDSAVGVLEAFAKENPDFRAMGSFYVNDTSFNDPKALPWLVEHGYEVGVHTVTHANLKQSSDTTVQKEIANNIAAIKAQAPDAKVNTIALPFGISPSNPQLLRSGEFEGKSYTLDAALLVGSNPAKSVFDADFDPYKIARIRSGPKNKPVETDSTYWLDLFDQGKWAAYTSDGDPTKISFPSTSTKKVGSKWADKANPYEPAGEGSGSSSSPSPSATASTPPSSSPEETPAATPTSTS